MSLTNEFADHFSVPLKGPIPKLLLSCEGSWSHVQTQLLPSRLKPMLRGVNLKQ